jgi:flagellar assembly protein FliH
MPRLIKAYEAGTVEFCCYERDTLEPPILINAHGLPGTAEQRDAILAEAKALAEHQVREAYAEGLRRGEAAGRAQFEASLAEAAQALAAAAGAIQSAHATFLDSLEPQVVALAHAIAAQVVQREANTDGDLVLRTVRRALEGLADRKRLVLRLHPKDLEALRLHKVTLFEEFDGVETIELAADDTVTPGGCVAESDTLHADARLEIQLQRALEALQE